MLGQPEARQFGVYMNGGVFPEFTGWELVLREKPSPKVT